MARQALDIVDTLNTQRQMYRSAAISSVYARVRQLAHLATGAADHLLAGADILDATGAGLPVEIDASLLVTLTDHQARWEAGRRVAFVTHLTALGADDALATAELFVTERSYRGFPPLHHPPALTTAQDAALRAVARGDVTISRDKPFVRHENLRVSISTIRALEARRLVGREKFPEWSHYERVHLTPEGCRDLAGSFCRPKAPTLTTTRPAAALTKATAGRSR